MKEYPHVFPDLNDWPIKKLADKRNIFISEIDEETIFKYKDFSVEELRSILLRTAYLELQRIRLSQWSVDPPKEKQFWKKVRKRAKDVNGDEEQAREELIHILSVIINQYSTEIVGDFKIKTFHFARKFLTFFFLALHKSFKLFDLFGFKRMKKALMKKMKVSGDDIDLVRKLCKQGTLVFVPTHFSNLDSILLGYMIDTKLGLPGFSYGAGLNLFNSDIAAYFMNRLGAYRIDRRKKNKVYLDTLKSMSELSIAQETNSLFFLGGTRSRSGSLESKLKLGLLGSAVAAQRRIYEEGRDHRIYIVPLIISYNYVLEAKSLIEQHLRTAGREKYTRDRQKIGKLREVFVFIRNLFRKGAEVHLSLGSPMDALGNRVDQKGNSLDEHGNEVNLKLYFEYDKELGKNEQREQVYTQRLADEILISYKRDNLVLMSHVLSYCAFKILEHEEIDGNLYNLFNYRSKETSIDQDTFHSAIDRIINLLRTKEKEGELRLESPILDSNLSTDELVSWGLKQLGIYHTKRVLYLDRYGSYKCQDVRLLYYYHNRLDAYDLDRLMEWDLIIKNELYY